VALFPNPAGILSLSLSLSICVYMFFKLLSLLVVVLGILSGHTAVSIGKSKVVVFGGLVDKKFLSDIVVYDIGTIFFSMSFGFLYYFSGLGFCSDS
jgi:hypothetical protein